ncbi:hypothetical protein SNK04_009173 [Fusarium graminearum]
MQCNRLHKLCQATRDMTSLAIAMASISVHGDDIGQAPKRTGNLPLPQPAIFHLFPNLPPEVRHQVWSWNVTLSEPQVHFLSQGNTFGGNSKNDTPHIGSPPLPDALMVNKESRSIALEHYKLFPRYPPDSYSLAQMPHGYSDPRKDILHIPNMLRNHDWSFGNIPFREITICMQKGDNPGGPLQFPNTHMQELTSNLPMELIKMLKQRLALGSIQPGESFAPSITFVCVDRQQRHSHYCSHAWPIDRPYNSRTLDSSKVAWTMPHSRKTSKWIAILHRSISGKLVDEPDRERYIPAVECTSMLLICKCRQVADRLRDGKYGNWIRHMERGKKAKPGYVWA